VNRSSAAAPAPTARLRRRLLWVGPHDSLELGLALADVAQVAEVLHWESPRAAVESLAAAVEPPAAPVLVTLLASDRPGRFSAADALLLTTAWPLVPIVSVASSLVDGRRRSGPPLPGLEEVAWHDLGGRCRWWLEAFDAGIPGPLGLPTTARREERLLAGIGARAADASAAGTPSPPVTVAVAATLADELEGVCDLLAVSGHRVVARHLGRPRLDEPAAAVVWSVCDLSAQDIEWLRLLAANAPGLLIVILASFPRGDVVLAARRAGAAAVLGKPASLEALAGSLLPARGPTSR